MGDENTQSLQPPGEELSVNLSNENNTGANNCDMMPIMYQGPPISQNPNENGYDQRPITPINSQCQSNSRPQTPNCSQNESYQALPISQNPNENGYDPRPITPVNSQFHSNSRPQTPSSQNESLQNTNNNELRSTPPKDQSSQSAQGVDLADSSAYSFVDQTAPVGTLPFEQNTGYNETVNDYSQASLSSQQSQSNFLSKRTPKEMIQEAAQQLIAEMNSKRKGDAELLLEYKKALDAQVSKTCASLENSLHGLYELQGEKIQKKIHELLCVLDRCSKLESELQEFSQTLNTLFLNS